MSIVNKHKAYVNGKARPEYEAWCGMIARCYRTTVRSYYLYGGRGIQVCPAWRKSFSDFFDHIGPKPTPEHSLDRIDGNGHYEPGNVRWATPVEQGQNTSRVRLLTKDGITLCAAEWERRYIRALQDGGPKISYLRLPAQQEPRLLAWLVKR